MGKELIRDLCPPDLLKVKEDHKCIMYRIVEYCILRREKCVVLPKNTVQETTLLDLMSTHVK